MYCPYCGAVIDEGTSVCPYCGNAVLSGYVSSAPQTPYTAPYTGTAGMPAQSTESKFTGGAFANAFIKWLTVLVSLITLGLAYPAMVCWHNRWEAKHTYYDGRQLEFTGRAGNLFGKYILWALLSIITLGIYYIFCARVAMRKWITKNTHFANGARSESEFDGTSGGLFGVKLLTRFVTIITLTFGAYWAHCYKERWFQKHTVIDGKRMSFNGRAGQYFGKRVLWTLLTIITIGIYGFWLSVKSKKWTVSHTHTEYAVNNGRIQAEQKKEPTTKLSTLGLVFSCLFFVPWLTTAGLICSAIAVGKKFPGRKRAIAGLVISCTLTVCVFLAALIATIFFG